jgi:hypothetical protein
LKRLIKSRIEKAEVDLSRQLILAANAFQLCAVIPKLRIF